MRIFPQFYDFFEMYLFYNMDKWIDVPLDSKFCILLLVPHLGLQTALLRSSY